MPSFEFEIETQQGLESLMIRLKNNRGLVQDIIRAQASESRTLNILHSIASFEFLVEAKSIVGLAKSNIWDAIHVIVKEAVGLLGEKKARAFITQTEPDGGHTPLHLACLHGNIEVIVGLYNAVDAVFAHNGPSVINEMLNSIDNVSLLASWRRFNN